MDRRQLMTGAAALGLSGFAKSAAALAGTPTGAGRPAPVPPPREVLSLNTGWRFFEGDIAMPVIQGHGWTYANAKAGNAQGAAAQGFDDTEWQGDVVLPHDFTIYQPIDRTANLSQGYRKRGVVWYRNLLRFDEADRGKHIEIQFDGIGTLGTVWFNGTQVAHSWSGYSSLHIDVTPFALFGEHYNSLVVRVDAVAMQGWWYEGGGLYRNAWVIKREATHIVTDGVFAHPVKSGSGWTIPVEVTLNTVARTEQAVTVVSELWDGDTKLAEAHAGAVVPSLRQSTVGLEISYDTPRLWSIEAPDLYTVKTRVERGGIIVDSVTTTCGFRTQRFDAESGFFLNDRHVKLQGVCLHQDHAGVGVAVPEALWDFRLRRLKALGCNAIRCAHNAPAKEFLDACDRLGFLVMDENRVFNPAPEHLAELQWMVRRDRNHPSVILWSVFNEEPMQGTEAGFEMVRRMREAVRELDTSRPVTGAMNDGLFTPVNVSQTLDVVGFNYQQESYDAFHKANPDVPLTSSEDTSSYSIRGEYATDDARHVKGGFDTEPTPWGETHRAAWKAIAERDYIAGGFVWTGFDYRGEPTPYEYPTNASLFGIMDSCGFEKVPFYIHQAQWVRNRPVINIAIHWNWAGHEGKAIKVMVCANTEAVELRLNGRLIGRQTVDPYEMNLFDVPYAPGHLEATGLTAGKAAFKTVVETTGPAVALRLVADRAAMNGDGVDAMPLTIEAVDAKGRVVPDASPLVKLAADGVDIIGVGNGDPNSLEPDKAYERTLFHGLAQVIVQSRPASMGQVTVTATAQGLRPGKTVIAVTPKASRALQATRASVQALENWFCAPLAATQPDPLARPGAGDNNSWQWFRAGVVLPAPSRDGFALCALSFTPYARIRRAGGRIHFYAIAGRAKIYVDGQLVGEKSDPDVAPLNVPLPAGEGERRVAIVFAVQSGQTFGLGDVVQVTGMTQP